MPVSRQRPKRQVSRSKLTTRVSKTKPRTQNLVHAYTQLMGFHFKPEIFQIRKQVKFVEVCRIIKHTELRTELPIYLKCVSAQEVYKVSNTLNE